MLKCFSPQEPQIVNKCSSQQQLLLYDHESVGDNEFHFFYQKFWKEIGCVSVSGLFLSRVK